MTTHRNPTRDAEEFAVKVVEGWVGTTGTVIDLSAGHEPDFRIEYVDGRLGIGEVTTHKSGQPQMIDLPSGLGTWSAQLVAGSNIPRLIKGVASLVQTVQQSGKTELTIYDKWPRGSRRTRPAASASST